MGNTKQWSRRDMLRASGMLAFSAAMTSELFGYTMETRVLKSSPDPRHVSINQPVRFVIIGYGSRGSLYASYSEKHPSEMKVVGVADIREIRRENARKKYGIDKKYVFSSWEEVFKVPRFADVIVVATPDNLHYGPAMKALEMGYDVLLEKPIAQTWQECSGILQQARKYNRIVGVCHVLRYTPYFRKLKEVCESGTLGEIVSMQHLEPIEHIHMSHSFVRGNWHNSKETVPILLAKSCHDLDLIRWLVGKPCRKVSSFGTLKWFREENAPAGSTDRCVNGCKAESNCPYSALKIYYRDRTWLHHFDFPEGQDQGEVIMKYLKESNYGRCVYHMDNDQCDHQVVSMLMEGNVTVNFSMEAFTYEGGRKTRIMGSMGEAYGDEKELYIADFRQKKLEKWVTAEHAEDLSGHGGGDMVLVKDFIQAVYQHKPELLTSTLEASMESHLIGFKAEESRHTGNIVDVPSL